MVHYAGSLYLYCCSVTCPGLRRGLSSLTLQYVSITTEIALETFKKMYHAKLNKISCKTLSNKYVIPLLLLTCIIAAIILMILFGVSNGYLGSAPMSIAPTMVADEYKEIAGTVRRDPLIFTTLSYAAQWCNDPGQPLQFTTHLAFTHRQLLYNFIPFYI